MKSYPLLLKYGIIALLGSLIGGCAAPTTSMVPQYSIPLEQGAAVEDFSRPEPGAVEYVWEPPLVDVIDVPPGLDPEGIYYMPAHQAVVEIRQGRWQYYRAPRN